MAAPGAIVDPPWDKVFKSEYNVEEIKSSFADT